MQIYLKDWSQLVYWVLSILNAFSFFFPLFDRFFKKLNELEEMIKADWEGVICAFHEDPKHPITGKTTFLYLFSIFF